MANILLCICSRYDLLTGGISSNLSRYPEQQPSEVIKKLSRLYNISKDKLVVMMGADEGIDILLVERISSTPNKNFSLDWFLPSLKKYKGSLSYGFLILSST